MARIRALVARVALACAAMLGVAAAEPLDLPDTRATITLEPAWSRVSTTGLVAGYRTADGALLAITRAPVPNPDAWRDKTRDAYVEQVEHGVLASGLRKVSRKLASLHGVPVLDVEARRKDGATVLVRVILFRTYALSAAAEIPKGVDATAARAAIATFTPPSTP